MEERESATLEVGSSNLLTHFEIQARLAEWIQARGCNPRQIGSIPVACSRFAEVAQQADARNLKLRELWVRFSPSAFIAGGQVLGWVS